MTLDLDTAIQRFENVAAEEIRRWFPKPNNCIAAVRMACEVFRSFGFESDPLPVRYECYRRDVNRLYVSSAGDSERDVAIQALSERDIAIQALSERFEDQRTSEGWQGHLVAIVERRWFIDPSWTAACEHLRVPDPMQPVVFKLPANANPFSSAAELGLLLDGGVKLELLYTPTGDRGFESAPAWETDHLEIAIEMLRRKMLGIVTEHTVLEQFVIYRRPMDYPYALVVRRWLLDLEGNMIADIKPWRVTRDVAGALERLRDEFERAGRTQLSRFQADDPHIVEVWF